MNTDWWRDVLRFFLDGLTLRQLINMLMIFIVLIILTPDSAKEWVNAHNPEVVPQYSMYYVLLFCVSFALRGFLSVMNKGINNSIGEYSRRKKDIAARKDILSLSEDEKNIVLEASDNNGVYISHDQDNDDAVIVLIAKGIFHTSNVNDAYHLDRLYGEAVTHLLAEKIQQDRMKK